MLTPLEIHNKTFQKRFRGYSEDEVDGFLDQIVRDYENLYRENIELKQTIDRVNSKLEHYQNMENTLHNTLVIVQDTAEEIKVNARKEAAMLLQEAQLRSQRLLDDGTAKIIRLAGEYEDLKKQNRVYAAKAQGMVRAQLQMLQDQVDKD